MEIVYLYCAFSYLWMIGYMMVVWKARKSKLSLVCTFAVSPITMPILIGIISS